MKPSYEEIMSWMKEYFSAYNSYAQSPESSPLRVRLGQGSLEKALLATVSVGAG